MKVLCLDASGSLTSIAWIHQEEGMEVSLPGGRGGGGKLFETIQEMVAREGKADRIVVGLGPGSYAGIRQAIACAQGLSLAWGSELGGWPSPAGIADDPIFQVVGDARRGVFYHTQIRDGIAVDGPRLLESGELEGKLMFRPSYAADPGIADLPVRQVSAVRLAKAALANWDSKFPALPFYLREPTITTAKNPPGLPCAL